MYSPSTQSPMSTPVDPTTTTTLMALSALTLTLQSQASALHHYLSSLTLRMNPTTCNPLSISDMEDPNSSDINRMVELLLSFMELMIKTHRTTSMDTMMSSDSEPVKISTIQTTMPMINTNTTTLSHPMMFTLTPTLKLSRLRRLFTTTKNSHTTRPLSTKSMNRYQEPSTTTKNTTQESQSTLTLTLPTLTSNTSHAPIQEQPVTSIPITVLAHILDIVTHMDSRDSDRFQTFFLT